jgi:hypothetical protein
VHELQPRTEYEAVPIHSTWMQVTLLLLHTKNTLEAAAFEMLEPPRGVQTADGATFAAFKAMCSIYLIAALMCVCHALFVAEYHCGNVKCINETIHLLYTVTESQLERCWCTLQVQTTASQPQRRRQMV